MTTPNEKKKSTFKDRNSSMTEKLKQMVAEKTGQSAEDIIGRQTVAEAREPSAAPRVPPPAAAEREAGGGRGALPSTKQKKDKAQKAASKPLGKHVTFFIYQTDVAKLQTLFCEAAQSGYTLNKSQLFRLVLRAAPANVLTSDRIAEIMAEDGRRDG